MANRYLILSMCSIISMQSTIAEFSFKKIYHKVIPQKMHQVIVYEEYNPKNIMLLTLKNQKGNVAVKTDETSKHIFLKAVKKSPEAEVLPCLAFTQKAMGQEMIVESKYDDKDLEGQIDFELILPEKIALNISTNDGDIKINDPHSSVRVAAHKGSITIFNAHNSVDAVTHLKGPITFHKPQGRIKAQTNNGKISIYDAQSTVVANTQYGSIEMYAKDVPSTSSIKLATVSGSIFLHLPPDVNADLQASTKQGVITSDHFITLKPHTTQLNRNAWKRIQKEVDGTIGSGEAQIKLSSIRSDIKVLEKKA